MNDKKIITKALSLMTVFVLIATVALTVCGCQGEKTDGNDSSPSVSENQEVQQTSFKFIVVDADGNETPFDIKTDEKTVGAALLKEGLIEGEDGQYGLYVKKVNGITADYDTDGTYWAFYVGDTYATSGVDATDITEGETYKFKIEKG